MDLRRVPPFNEWLTVLLWMQQNTLQNNVGKLDAVSADGTKHSPATLSLVIGADVIIPFPCVKNLGVVIDSHLSLEAQIRSV
jgi:hypothetical protein